MYNALVRGGGPLLLRGIEDHMFMRMGHENIRSSRPLWCNVTGNNVVDVLSHVQGDHLDVRSCIVSTLFSGGIVLVVGAGELRHLRGLTGAGMVGRPVRAKDASPTNEIKWLTSETGSQWATYDRWVLTTPWGTAPHDLSVVGRVNLQRLRAWCDCKHAARRL